MEVKFPGHRDFAHCNIGLAGGEYHLVIECHGRSGLAARTHSRNPGFNMLFRRHHVASTMVQFMWQADLHWIAQVVTDCLSACYMTATAVTECSALHGIKRQIQWLV